MKRRSGHTDLSTGTLVWSRTEQAPVGDCCQLQDDLTQHIVASFELPLSAGDKRRLTTDVPSSTQAYDYFLRGNQLCVDAKQWSLARDLYEQCGRGSASCARPTSCSSRRP